MPTRRETRVTALTLEEARERSQLLDVHGYRVDLDVTLKGEKSGHEYAGVSGREPDCCLREMP
jgi:hypothetical protein